MLADVQHTDAGAQARFASLTIEQQLLDIWLNTRETNGAVATVMTRLDHIEPMVNKHERYTYLVAALFGLLIVGAPFLLYVLNHVRWE